MLTRIWVVQHCRTVPCARRPALTPDPRVLACWAQAKCVGGAKTCSLYGIAAPAGGLFSVLFCKPPTIKVMGACYAPPGVPTCTTSGGTCNVNGVNTVTGLGCCPGRRVRHI